MRKFWKTYFSWDGLSARDRQHLFKGWIIVLFGLALIAICGLAEWFL